MPTDITIECTPIEAGMLVSALSASATWSTFPKETFEKATDAWVADRAKVVVSMSHVEAGMALEALSRSPSLPACAIVNRLLTAINETMAGTDAGPLAVAPDTGGAPAAGMDPADAPSDNPPTGPQAEPEANEAEPAADDKGADTDA